MTNDNNGSSGVTAQIRIKRCYGCGAILQDQYPNEKGYLPPEKFKSDEESLCQRCYKLRHYSAYKEAPSLNNDYLKILNEAKANSDLIVYVLNAFSLESSIISNINEHLSSNVLIIINKRDIVDTISDNRILNKCEELLASNNIKVKDIILTSSSNNNANNIEEISSKIDNLRNGKSVYFIGVNQVGKSSLVNSMLKHYTNRTNKMITTSPYPGTTLEVIAIPLDENTYIYDTPGIENPDSIISHIEPTISRFLLPRDKIKPYKETFKPGQSLVISNFLKVDLLDGKKVNFTCYFSNDLPIEKINFVKADAYLNDLKNGSNTAYFTSKVQSYSDLVETKINAIPGKRNVLRIFGLGFIEFDGDDQVFSVFTIDGVKVIVYNA